MLFLSKRNNKTHKCRSFGKGTTEIKSVVPLEKEQQNTEIKKKNKMTVDPKGVELLKKEEPKENVVILRKGTTKNSNGKTLIQKYVQK